MQIVDNGRTPSDQTGAGAVVHPLRVSCNALTAVGIESQSLHRFAVASNEYSSSNAVVLLDFDEDTRVTSVFAQVESLQPIQHLLDFSGYSELTSLLLSQKDIANNVIHVKIVTLDNSGPSRLSEVATSGPLKGAIRSLMQESGTGKKSNTRLSVVQPESIVLLQVNESSIDTLTHLPVSQSKANGLITGFLEGCGRKFYTGKFDPHHRDIFAVAIADRFELYDWRQNNEDLITVRGGICHTGDVLDIDFNPNVPNELVTVGEDDKMVFWDLRATVKPLQVVNSGHKASTKHVKYNSFHDQLIVTGGPSDTVILRRESKETRQVYQSKTPSRQICWSATDAWHFAALSGNSLLFHETPEQVKYKLLL